MPGRDSMGHLPRLRVIVVHNRDFDPDAADDPTLASRADVENAARDVERALTARGHQAQRRAVEARDSLRGALETVEELTRRKPDLVFNLCESLGGDARHEAVLPSLLELAGIPYTGSGPLGLSVALRKDLTKRLLQSHGVPTPVGVVVDEDRPSAELFKSLGLEFPLIVKPTREDASVGISMKSVVRDRRELFARVAEVRARFHQPALVERFVDGRELYVSLVGGAALPMHEIDFSAMPAGRPRIVSYEGKWNLASDEYHGTRPVHAEGLDARVRALCVDAARGAFAALELRDYARVDLRLAEGGRPFVIDVNPNCDLSDGAGVSRAASFGGLAYPDLIERICEVALARHRGESPLHVDRGTTPAAAVSASAAGALADGEELHPPPAAERPSRAPAAGVRGRAVHEGRGVGRARAHRRRAR
jgi:D-alanine-D-alanine ligase